MIKVNQLTMVRGQKTLFDPLSFHLSKGSVTAILGGNGRGKTTLLRLILGTIKPTRGCVYLTANTAYVPQQEAAVFPYSVKTMVMLGRVRHMGWFASPSHQDQDVAMRCLDCFGLLPLADKPVNQLSGGERQLVCIARALASEPEILILDEPAAALDLSNQGKVLTGLRELSTRLAMTVLFTTHSPLHALHIADLALLLYPQGEAAFGATREILTDENLTRLYQLPVHIDQVTYADKTWDTVVPLFN
ncbi:ABC transporter ATP-binding protein [Yersinia ruckeri]|uniref:ABC transporter ATP-binding protein n=1 Tax=Yersinia ruckeri TaxID=29486 RepID=UPI002238E95F|nr:ABC transporter ATP-binding protein [Yersinia ruckeri]MCW6568830.1 ABC transporter ATP-binding protein [Yersinia ruckeri]